MESLDCPSLNLAVSLCGSPIRGKFPTFPVLAFFWRWEGFFSKGCHEDWLESALLVTEQWGLSVPYQHCPGRSGMVVRMGFQTWDSEYWSVLLFLTLL